MNLFKFFVLYLLTPPAPFHHFDIPNRWWCHIWTLPRMAMLGLWKLWRFKCSNPKFRIFLHKDKENNVNNVLQKMTMADSWVLQGLTQSCVLVKSSIKVEYWIPNKSFFAGKLESSMYKRSYLYSLELKAGPTFINFWNCTNWIWTTKKIGLKKDTPTSEVTLCT